MSHFVVSGMGQGTQRQKKDREMGCMAEENKPVNAVKRLKENNPPRGMEMSKEFDNLDGSGEKRRGGQTRTCKKRGGVGGV